MSSVDAFIQTLRSLGDPRDMESSVNAGDAFDFHGNTNTHVHLPPNFSAFQSLQQALDMAVNEGVKALGASNYYDYSVYGQFATLAMQKGIFPLFGIEIIALMEDLVENGTLINDPGNFGKIYICGKGITKFSPMSENASRLLQTIRVNDSLRMNEMTRKLSYIFVNAGIDIALTPDIIKERIATRTGVSPDTVYLQERHLAQAFQEAFYESTPVADRSEKLRTILGASPKNAMDPVLVQNDIRTYLMKAGGPAFEPDTFVNFEHAYTLILALGGIPSYPTLADGAKPICAYEEPVEDLIEKLRRLNVHAAEFIPNRNTPEVLSRYVHAIRDAGFVVTAGTEHNTQELLPITPACVGGTPIPKDVQDIFCEGACVLVTHQYLSLMGLTGFVESDGTVNSRYGSDNERISFFRALGERILMKYQEATSHVN
jgi:hypothetical protein